MKATELILTSDQAAAIDWKKAKPSNVGEATGRDGENGAFWARADGLEYVPFVDIVERTLEAHGWETNIENLLFSLESARLARRVIVTTPSSKDASDKLALAFETVFAMELPQRGKSGKLLKRLYALVSGAPNGSAQAVSPSDIEKHPVVQVLQRRIEELEETVASLSSERAGLLEALKKAGQSAPVHMLPTALRAEGGVEVRPLEVKAIDLDRRRVILKSADRTAETDLSILPRFPSVGARALGLFESRKLTGVIPSGDGWAEYAWVPARILAVRNSCIKFVVRGRQEFLLPLQSDSPSHLRRLRRSDEVVVKISGNFAIDICSAGEGFEHDANLRERTLQLRAEEFAHQSFIRRQTLETTDILKSNEEGRQPKARRAS